MLSDMLTIVAERYVYERGKDFAGSNFANYVRRDIAKEAKKSLIFLPHDLKVKASIGAGNWAAVPWLAFFDPLITQSATKGFYVVYLINPQDRTIVLSMNQGTTAVYNEFGRARGREVLRRRAIDIAERIPDFSKKFDLSEIYLGSTEDLPLGYQSGHAFGRTYLHDDIDSATFQSDLETMLFAYAALVEKGGTLPVDFMQEEAGTTDIEETRKYILSRRIERAPNVRKKVLSLRQPICECCGLDPVQDYNFSGPLINTPLDIHHASPLRNLSEGESKRYKIPDDFIVLCPTCHRMIHKQNNPSDLEFLKRKVSFKFMRELNYRMT